MDRLKGAIKAPLLFIKKLKKYTNNIDNVHCMIYNISIVREGEREVNDDKKTTRGINSK